MKMVKVFVAMKRKLQAGDKMAGRHGNEGVISRIVPAEDMPYMKDGRPVDIVLNPLWSSKPYERRQILETHLGWACSEMGEKIKKLIEDVQKNSVSKKKLKSYLGKIYKGDVADEIKNLSDLELGELSHNLSSGVPIATPGFDGASVKDVLRC